MDIKRIDMYLNRDLKDKYYTNTPQENILVSKFQELYDEAKSYRDGLSDCSPQNLDRWRRAYLGTLGALKADGKEESDHKGRQLRKFVYEIVESKIDNSIPMPKMKPRYKTDLPLVDVTENMLKFEADRILTKYENDRSERAILVDGAGWYKVVWDSMANTHERSGDPRIEFCPVDKIAPQPGVVNYKQLEYIFEDSEVSATKIYDLYGRLVPGLTETRLVNITSCYYLNDEHIVGLFVWDRNTMTVICNETDWQIRKLRTCCTCGEVVPNALTCPICGSKRFKYENAKEEILSEDLYEIYNPYDVGETTDETQKDKYQQKIFLEKGSKVPFYRINQLPFVPRPAVSSMTSIYGISEVKIILESQDAINKVLTKALEKTLRSGAVVTKPNRLKLNDTNETFKVLNVKSPEEAQMVQTKQIVADTSNDLLLANIFYDAGKMATGVTESFQGQQDKTATSGKAKQIAAVQTAGRIESLRVMKSAAFSGVYELLLKYLLAFSDESRKFVKVTPEGDKEEESWNKYMFLAKDDNGEVYYRDDFTFDSDPASTLSQNRVQMWQETQDKFVNGAFGNPADLRTLKLFWNTMDSLQYPLAKIALAGIDEMEQHLPADVEQAIMANPEALQMFMASLTDTRGGARPNSGPDGNGATHAANVERTNDRNRALNRDVPIAGQTAIPGGVGNANA